MSESSNKYANNKFQRLKKDEFLQYFTYSSLFDESLGGMQKKIRNCHLTYKNNKGEENLLMRDITRQILDWIKVQRIHYRDIQLAKGNQI